MSDRPLRIEVWTAYRHTQDKPYRRSSDRRWGFAYTTRPHGRQWDWPSVFAAIGKRAVAISTFHDRHFHARIVQVYLGPRAVVAEKMTA